MSAGAWVALIGAVFTGVAGIVTAWAAVVKARGEADHECEEHLHAARLEAERSQEELHRWRMAHPEGLHDDGSSTLWLLLAGACIVATALLAALTAALAAPGPTPGPPGPPGPIGARGPTGLEGLPGPPGPTATTVIVASGAGGTAGDTGATGSSGTAGATGSTGPAGESMAGPPGPPGPPGPAGVQGERGATGLAAPTCPSGFDLVTLEVRTGEKREPDSDRRDVRGVCLTCAAEHLLRVHRQQGEAPPE